MPPRAIWAPNKVKVLPNQMRNGALSSMSLALTDSDPEYQSLSALKMLRVPERHDERRQPEIGDERAVHQPHQAAEGYADSDGDRGPKERRSIEAEAEMGDNPIGRAQLDAELAHDQHAKHENGADGEVDAGRQNDGGLRDRDDAGDGDLLQHERQRARPQEIRRDGAEKHDARHENQGGNGGRVLSQNPSHLMAKRFIVPFECRDRGVGFFKSSFEIGNDFGRSRRVAHRSSQQCRRHCCALTNEGRL